jgi:hypothetical protein
MSDDGGCCGCLAAAVLLAVGGALYLAALVKRDDAESQKRFEARAAKVAPFQVSISDLRLQTRPLGDLTGRIANDSRDSVDIVELKLTIYDCEPRVSDLRQCTVVASPDPTVYETIPPSESRDFRAYVNLPTALTIRGEMRWTYRVSRVFATSP